MVAIISLLLVVVLSLLVVRVATVALTLTGLSRQLARFQARSAFTGSGFTTSESEKVVQHPVRRRIIMLLMLLGNAGIVTAVSSLILTFAGDGGEGLLNSAWMRIAVLAAGLSGLWIVAHSQWVDRRLSRMIEWALKRWTDLEVRDYAGLLHLSGDYSVAELQVEPQDWLAGRMLRDLRLSDEGVLVLGLEKSTGTYLGAPRGQTLLETGDIVILYGPHKTLENLDVRRHGREGVTEHHEAVDRRRRMQQEEETRQSELEQAEADPAQPVAGEADNEPPPDDGEPGSK